MSLNIEWRSRVEAWISTLDALLYRPLTPLPLEAVFTHDQLTAGEAAARTDYAPIAPGTRWGVKWQYAWFRAEARIPETTTDSVLVLHAGLPTPQFGGDIYGEWRVFIDGVEIGSRDWAHVHLPLPDSARARGRFSFLAEAFGGPTRAGAGGGPALDGVPTLPEPPTLQRVLPEVTVGLWREEVFQLKIDARTLLELRDQLDPASLRVAEIDAALRDFTLIADLELPWPQLEPTLRAARERLRPLLECRNGSTAPLLFCVGHSHLDVVYQWPLKEAERKVARTFANQLGLMERYPEYRYTQSMPVLYDIARRLHPAIYRRVKDAVRRGQWIPEGGMWTEPDTNLPDGESLVRHFLYGKRFFREEFGVDSELAWLPDTFGFSAALPQIMAGCGITALVSAKPFCVFVADAEPFPYSTFYWEGLDGTRVLTHFAANYGITTNPAEIAGQWRQNPQKDGLRARMAIFGHSDGGGGCERSHLEFLRRQTDLEGQPRCRHATPHEFFEFQRAQPEPLPTFSGEIYLPAHRGTYTTQAALKLGNRRCEAMLREAEFWSAAAAILADRPYPATALESAWKKTLFNQFHDILPGSCIERAASEARELYAESLAESAALARDAARALSHPERPATPRRHAPVLALATRDDPLSPSSEVAAVASSEPADVTVFNSLSWPRTALVAVENVPAGAIHQTIGGRPHIEVEIPACGWSPAFAACRRAPAKPFPQSASPLHLENRHARLQLDSRGRIISWLDRATGRELAAAPLNDFRMFRDTPRVCDAWEIESHYAQQPVPLEDEAEIDWLARGPLALAVRIRRRLHHSDLEQEIWLRHDSPRIELKTRVHWTEKHKLLKVCFPLAISTDAALHEIQFGHLRRPTHRSRQIDRDRFEVCQQRWTALAEETRGVALLNDCKYGIDAEGGTLGLTLLRSPQAPDLHADIGHHEFTYALYAWQGPFSESHVTRHAAELNTPLLIEPGAALPATSLFVCEAPGVIIDAVKLAEDGSGDVVVRLHEALRTTTRCRLRAGFPFTRASETDLLENSPRPLAVHEAAVDLDFRPFEIKTLRLRPR